MTVLTFDEARHTYHLAGRRLPNVTSVTDSLLREYLSVPADVMERARDRGTAVHLATQLHDEGDLDEDGLPPEIAPYLDAWKRLREETGFEPTAIEERVYSATYSYAGTLDRVGTFARLKGVRPTAVCLLDIKATAALMPAAAPQTAAYARAWDEHRPRAEHIKHRFVAHLRGDGTYRLAEHKSPTDLSVFLAAATLRAWRERHGATTEE